MKNPPNITYRLFGQLLEGPSIKVVLYQDVMCYEKVILKV